MKEKVRSVLVRKPNASQYELARILEIDKKTAWRLKKQVIAENTKRISDQKVNEEVGKMEAEAEQLAFECWQVITQDVRKVKTTKDGKEIEVEVLIPIGEKLRAVRAIIEARKTLFNIKFDSGVFSRKLGELELGKGLTQEEQDLIKKVIEMDYGKKPTKPEPKPDSTAGNDLGKPSTAAGENKPE